MKPVRSLAPSSFAVFLLALTVFSTSSCTDGGSPDGGSDDPEEDALLAVKGLITDDLEALRAAAIAIEAGAPTPDIDGWNHTSDAAAVTDMKTAWKDARGAYERIEGAIAVLFPDLDAATDERYDGFLGEGPDTNLFDDEGVTGVHAIERILWADAIRANVVAFESALPGYSAAAPPSTEAEATDFKTKLTTRLVNDTTTMRDDFAPLALDTPAAYRGVIGSMEEQIEKVMLAGTGEDESRYAQYTLADMRANLEGARRTFEAFVPWLEREGADAVIDDARTSFARIDAHYDGITGDAIPDVPASWNPDAPSAADLATPYGQLFTLLQEETDPENAASNVAVLTVGAEALDIPTLE
jgi:iron uptake system component EfeO